MNIQSGQLLTKQEVLDLIISNASAASNNSKNDYEDLCMIFEASFGYSVDMNLDYDNKWDRFKVYETTGN